MALSHLNFPNLSIFSRYHKEIFYSKMKESGWLLVNCIIINKLEINQ